MTISISLASKKAISNLSKYSNNIPNLIQYLQGGILINFNIEEINNSLDNITQYQYNSIFR